MDLVIEHRRAWQRQSRVDWTLFHRRLGVGPGQFAERLVRARLLYLCGKQITANWLALIVALGVLPLLLPVAPAAAGSFDSVRSGSLLLRKKGSDVLEPAARVDTRIEARVSGMIARVTVRQQFRNDTAEWMDGTYVFPLAEKAAVDRLEMHIGEHVIVGEIREREAARKVYEQARTAGKQASLVEQERPNLFTTSLANVPPGETVEVQIGYLESLDYVSSPGSGAGEWRMRIPLTITPRYIPGAVASESSPTADAMRRVAQEVRDTEAHPDGDSVPDADRITPPVDPGTPASQRASISVALDAGVRLIALGSLYHPVVTAESAGAYHVTLKDGMVPADRDFELVWSPDVGTAPAAAIFTERLGAETYALLMLMPPHESTDAPRAPREVILILDTSGSMEGTSLLQAKAAVELALARLGPQDTFDVIQFNSVTETLFPRPLPATADNVRRALEYVRNLQATGGTEMRAAFEAAFALPAGQGRLRQIVFMTDGAVGNEEELFRLIESRLGTARLFTVGIGSAPNGHFMRSAAAAGRGSFTFIGSGQQVHERMAEVFRKIENPALTDVELQWPAGVQAQMALSEVPDLYYGEPVVVTARLQGEPAGLLSLTGRGASGAWVRQMPLSSGRAHEGVASLWARNRIQDLLERRRSDPEPGRVRAQIVELALAHHLVSPYTSLVAVDRTPVRPETDGSVARALALTAPAGSAWAAGSVAYPAAATDARWHLWIGSGLLLLGLFVMRRRQAVRI